jgi:hypothetical protein
VPGVERLAGVEHLEGVLSGFASARDGIDTLLRDRGLRRTAPELTAESLLRGAHASAVLAGSRSSLDDVRAGAGDAIAQAALRISVEVLTAAVVHAEISTGEPFGSADGLVARAAERLVLASSGVDAKSLVVPEAGHLANRPAYESNLRGYASGSRAGLQAWLVYCSEAYAAGAEASPLRDQ